ncbi:protein TOPLESS-like isoform X1 [Mangifera indica]|uniref:protein TOPLESS-like isoform X1 n=2 Tax=Mangifera indica TaxID=29780 RepID=UPI001CF97E4D|nr:protein TOPLESS-like isoform X1 [Mangifera indica]
MLKILGLMFRFSLEDMNLKPADDAYGFGGEKTAKQMPSLTQELVFLILQFFDEEGYKESACMLARESGYYFDLKFFEDLVLDGKWEEVERYLSSFTKVDDNRYSTKIFFEVRKQNFLEALDSHNHPKALNILMKDLKVFAPENEALFKEMTQLLTLDDIREHQSLSMYGDAKSARKIMMLELQRVIEANPLLRDKLKFPSIKSHRLRRLINQSLNWQHIHCTNPQPDPNISTLFENHVCQPQDSHLFSQPIETNSLPSQAPALPASASPANWNPSPSSVNYSAVSNGPFSLVSPVNPDPTKDDLEDSEIVSEKKPSGFMDRVKSPVNSPGSSHSSLFNIPIDLPKTVVQTLNEGSSPVCMDFHPVGHTLLLVGTNIGDIGLWDVNSREKLLSRNFKVWHIGACSMLFKTALVKDPFVSVNCVTWSSDGVLFGVAYSKHMLQLYSYHGGINIQQKLEIDAHIGGVNDLAFSKPGGKKLLVITCGDDKTIKVWDVVNGANMYTFEGHDTPVYSICPHTKEHISFIFSTSVDGKIKAWLYDNLGARINYDAPGLGCTTMAYSANDQRLFSCGTTKDGQSFLVEWDESEGSIKRTYQGLRNDSLSVVQFDTAKDRYLAAGDDHVIKIWDMDKVELLTTIDADGGLPANPRIRFNKQGSFLACIANENRIKILATDSGHQLMHTADFSLVGSGDLSDTLRKLAINPISTVASAGVTDAGVPIIEVQKNLKNVKLEISGESSHQTKIWKPLITRPSQFQSLQLPSHVKENMISKLIYTNAGNAILALASNATHLFWKWPKTDLHLSGKATCKVVPQLWQPRNCSRFMVNDTTGSNPQEVVSCFALSKNDSYLISASGGIISLFNMLTFKTMMTIMPPSPAATCLAFFPQDNNIVAIGMDDFSILIYNVRFSEVKSKLEGHHKRISGLAFSNALDIMVSSGADGQIIVWNVDGWEKQKCRFLQFPAPVALTDTYVQFHEDQIHFLAFNKSHLAIYEAKKLECLKQWVAVGSSCISQATFSCDSQMVYASFVDGTVSIFDASNLGLHCRILPSAYLPPTTSIEVYPHAIAANPEKPTQFAVGLTDGGVHVFEPQEPGDNWAVVPLPPDENEPSKVD